MPFGHVPATFWDTSSIFLTDQMGNIVPIDTLPLDAVYNVAAVVGNGGSNQAGRLSGGPLMWVQCDAFCFNTFLSPSVQLPPLSNLDPASANMVYEQFFIEPLSWEIAGFRFDVDAVFKGLTAAMIDAAFTQQQLGGSDIDGWLKGGHACVKVRIMSGEYTNSFTPPAGPVPDLATSIPPTDRHIAQRNLGPFALNLKGAKKFGWTNFIVAQAGAGLNGLALQQKLPADAFRFYVAIPTQTYGRYFAKGRSHRGFEVVREPPSKPFPDAVILRQTHPEARIEVASHIDERFLGMSLGIEYDPAHIKEHRFSDVVMVHTAHDGEVVGGFTLRPQAVT